MCKQLFSHHKPEGSGSLKYANWDTHFHNEALKTEKQVATPPSQLSA